MKRVVFLLLSVLMVEVMSAQDIIVKKDGNIMKSKVVELTETQIKYKNYTNLDGPLYTINIGDVLSITYENGERETFFNTDKETVKDEEKDDLKTNSQELSKVSDAVITSRIADLKAKRKTTKIVTGVTTGILAGGALVGGIISGSAILIVAGPIIAVIGGFISGGLTKSYDEQIDQLE